MSAAPDILASFIKFIAYVPFSIVPVVTWSVFTAVALSLYFYYPPMMLDYIFTPIALAFIMYSAYRRDGWGGVAGAALGIALVPMLNWMGMLADATALFFHVFVYLAASLIAFTLVWGGLVFTAGFFAGLVPLLSIIFGLLGGLILGFALSGVSMYISYVTGTIRRFIYKITSRLPPGAMALTAIPTAALVAAIELLFVMIIIAFAILFIIGYFLGTLVSVIVASVTITLNSVSFLIGIIISQFWHRIEYEAFSPAVFMAVIVAFFTFAATPAMIMALSTASLLTPRQGYRAYTWIAVALTVHAMLYAVLEVAKTAVLI